MQIFYGQCKIEICNFVWACEGCLPNFCPECGQRLFHSNEEILEAKKNVVLINVPTLPIVQD